MVLSMALAAAAFAQQGATDGEWHYYSGDPGSTKYAPLSQIDASNAADLEIVWRRPAVDASIHAAVPNLRYGASYRSSPLMIDGRLYAPNGIGFVEAFDAGTGATIWSFREPDTFRWEYSMRASYGKGVGYAEVDG
jgi:quinoprotein glucose dehydrogenase